MTSRMGVKELKRLIAERLPMEAWLVDAEIGDFDGDGYGIWLDKFAPQPTPQFNVAMQSELILICFSFSSSRRVLTSMFAAT
jgi:hypothetical protein